MMKNKKFLAGFVIAIGSFVSLITSVVMFAKKEKRAWRFLPRAWSCRRGGRFIYAV